MKKVLILLCVVSLFSCNRINQLENENKILTNRLDSLVKENENLKKELKEFKNSPDRLLFAANEAYKTSNYDDLDGIYKKIKKFHPTSDEAVKVGLLLKKLETELKERIEKEKSIRLASVKKLKKEYDDISDITWYSQPYFKHYTNSNRTSIYIAESGSSVWLRLKMSYTGDDWIFFESAYLSYDGNTIEIPFNKFEDKKTENDTEVWEWIDLLIKDDIISFLHNMVNGKEIKMRLSGKYTHTRNLSAAEINGIKDVLIAYDVLKSEKSK